MKKVLQRHLWRTGAALRRITRRGAGRHPMRQRGRPVARVLHARRLRRGGDTARRWLEESAAAHAARREAGPSVSGIDATVVCVTNRPGCLEEVIANYERQRHPNKSLVVVANSSRFDHTELRERLRHVNHASMIDIDEDESLGACLNVALEGCTTRYLAKFDDDDRYGAEYLGDMLLAHRWADAGVVGKQSYFAYLENLDLHVLRFPGREFAYTSFVSGATLVLDLDQVGGVQFRELNVGEDTEFIKACQRRGTSIFSADRFNYLQRRGNDNTWKAWSTRSSAKSLPIDPTTPAGSIEL